MSHFTRVQTQIKDVAALDKAVTTLGCTLDRSPNQRVYGYYGPGEAVDMNIRVPGTRYTVGVKREQNNYGLVADFWDQAIERRLGRQCGRLLQEYSFHVIQAQAQRQGLRVTRRQRDDGSLVVALAGFR